MSQSTNKLIAEQNDRFRKGDGSPLGNVLITKRGEGLLAMKQTFTWQGIEVCLSHTKNWLNTGHDHIVLKADERLPITETGYRSHFIHPDELALFDCPEDFVRQWLDRLALTKKWQAHWKDRQQLSLF